MTVRRIDQCSQCGALIDHYDHSRHDTWHRKIAPLLGQDEPTKARRDARNARRIGGTR